MTDATAPRTVPGVEEIDALTDAYGLACDEHGRAAAAPDRYDALARLRGVAATIARVLATEARDTGGIHTLICQFGSAEECDAVAQFARAQGATDQHQGAVDAHE